MPDLATAKASNDKFSPSYIPVAVIVGGTSGIGEAMIKAIAHYTGGKVHLITIGRNRTAAEKTFASLPTATAEDGKPVLREFVFCNAELMENIKTTATDLSARLTKINYLILSAGYADLWSGRQETEEGIDKLLGLRYYSRFKYTYELLPLLRNAKDAGEDAKVMSILASGLGRAIDVNDLGMKHSYKAYKATLASGSYNDIMVEEFAKRNPEISFTHIYPGFVDTPGTRPTHWALRLFTPLIVLLVWLAAISPQESAEYMLFALFDGEKGFFHRGSKGDDLGTKGYSFTDEEKRAVWEHSVEVTRCA
ncbi:NAD(P)-binding protein [Guyanagaster necrorhizus]|uniref:NAD(P)-binding protein n=1 Tax=Guyanagaster necrorhizus TaxID=856835 RepID=A0A9P7VPB0_9AGAR|nr:NAD(P)-binding protein [Guyanagaster necrorhizus MCA 3950]KAG7444000.1 NAD(P)-binding protein [Guyanagaster necrorhizus MCA 3950]